MHAHARRAAQQALRCAGGSSAGHVLERVLPPAAVAACARAASGVAAAPLPLAHASASVLAPPPPPPHALPPALLAVPKRKVTPSRKGKRSEGKHLRFAQFVSRCATCGRVKQPHWHCPHCASSAPTPPAAPADAA